MMTTKLLTERTFLSGGGGGGAVHVHPMQPPAYAPERSSTVFLFVQIDVVGVMITLSMDGTKL